MPLLACRSATARSPRAEEALGANGDTVARDVRGHRGFARGTAWYHPALNAPTCREEAAPMARGAETEHERAVQLNGRVVRRTAPLRHDRLLLGAVAACTLLLGFPLVVA